MSNLSAKKPDESPLEPGKPGAPGKALTGTAHGPSGKKWDSERLILAAAGPVIALVLSLVVTGVVLLASGKNPVEPFQLMFEQIGYSDQQVLIINQAGVYYLAALAVAVGFRMNLFNIGVDGQYRLAACVTAIAGFHLALPQVLQIPVLLIIAMLTGALWAGVAGVLKVTRGVSEVVATIMLNSIATALIVWLCLTDNFGVPVGNNQTTGVMDKAGWFPGIGMGDAGEIYGFVFVAVLAGVVYWLVLNRTRFGFDLRASGASEEAAAASGVSAKRMTLTAMLLSGAVAGLAGLPILLGDTHTYSQSFPSGLGFTGITIALLGRNNPLGIAAASLLIAFLDKASSVLDYNGYEKEIATIMQGIIVIAVVVSYEQVRLWGLRRQQRRVGLELAAAAAAATPSTEVKKEAAAR
ncbi:nucleoside ABC transporter membrane protein [Streptomyces sp. TverLS-915]|uniref:ABC transporter permease n=1 Tax=unclassified Streptomyces TaxID=2593676 RepID=UPI00081F6C7D|nr:ABC transporter permease [Streptomyces sp. TverLS-915]SCD55243.1 nucleoside ABC transporter membrane protein [Streptomyces sp. TverLS-915]